MKSKDKTLTQRTLSQSRYSQQALHLGLLAKPTQDIQELGEKNPPRSLWLFGKKQTKSEPEVEQLCLSSLLPQQPCHEHIWYLLTLNWWVIYLQSTPRQCSFTPKGLLLHVYFLLHLSVLSPPDIFHFLEKCFSFLAQIGFQCPPTWPQHLSSFQQHA